MVNAAAADRVEVWGIEVTGESLSLLDARTARRAHAAGVNTLLLGSKLTAKQVKRATRIAHRNGFALARVTDVDSTASTECTSSGATCVLTTASLAKIAALARIESVDAIGLRVKQAAGFRTTAGAQLGGPNLIALVSLRGKPRRAVWDLLIGAARTDESLQLAVSPAGPSRADALSTYLSYLSRSDVNPPEAPKRLSLVAATQSSLRLAWQASRDNVGVASYGIYRGETRMAEASAPTFELTSLACGTTYEIGVDAVDAAGNRSKRASLRAATSPCAPTGESGGGSAAPAADNSPPTTPASISTSGSTQTSFIVLWSASSDNVGVAGYGIYLNGAPAGETPSNSHTLTGLNCGTTYTVSVDAYDGSGNRSGQATTTASTSACSTPDTTAPTAPTALARTGNTASTISVSWNASTDNVAVAGYRLYRNGVSVGTTTGTSFTVSGLTCNTTYIIGVAAYDAAGNQSPSDTEITSTAACPAPDTTAPTQPTGLAAPSSTGTSISLAWTASTDNIGVTGYGIYNGATLLAASPSTSFTVAGLTCGTSYSLSVDAVDAAGNRSGRASISASTTGCPVPDSTPPTAPPNLAKVASTATTITLSWNSSSDNDAVAGYSTYRGGTLVSTTTALSWIFTGLACGTTYSLEVEAYDAAGNRSPRSTISASTNDCPDTTAPSAPTGLTRAAATATTITLSWTAATDDVGVTGYATYRNGTAAGTPTTTSYTFTGLTCGTTYTLGVEALDAATNVSPRSTLSAATTACADTTAPSAPTGLTRSAATTTSITLSWTASTDNVGVTGYTAYRGTAGQGDTTATSFTFTGLSCGTTYTLGVEAFDASGNRSSRPTLSAATNSCADTTAPSAPTDLTRTAATATSITLGWTASTDNVGVTGYDRLVNGTLASSGAGTSFTFTGLTCGTTYTLGLEAFDAAGNRSTRSTLSAATTACTDSSAPTAPTGLTRSAGTTTSITLTWTASTDNVGVTGYSTFRDGTAAGTPTATTYTFTGLACGTTYTLGVEATDAAGNRSSRSTLAAATAGCPDSTAPSAPTALTRSAATTTSITLSWTASTDNVGVTGYTAYRGTAGQGDTTATSFTFTGLTCGTSYTLGVEAYDAAGNRSTRPALSAATASCPDTAAPSAPTGLLRSAATTTSITLSWTASTDNVGVTGYSTFRDGASVTNTLSSPYTFTGLACGTTYILGLEAYDAAGNRSTRSTLSAATAACADMTAPSAPTALTKGTATTTSIPLTWTASTDNVGVTGYSRYLNGTLVSSATGTSFTFTGLACGTTYTLGVEAYDAAGNRSTRSTLSAATASCPDTTAPTAPTALTRSAATATSITLSWAGSTDNVAVTGYTAYRGTASQGNTTTTSFTFTGLACGTTYTLGVEAYDAAGNRSTRPSISSSTSSCPDTSAPSAPTGLTRSAATGTTITLSWTASTDAVGVTGYTAYRGTTGQGDTTTTSFTFTGLTCGTTYTLGVEAYDAAGNRSTRPTLNAATAACPDTTAPSAPTALTRSTATTTSITLGWTASTDNVGVTGYSRYLNGTLVSSATGTSFTFTGLACGTSYTLGVEAYDAAGNRSTRSTLAAATAACPDTTAPTAPTGLTRTAGTTTSITLGWTASTDNVAVTGYSTFRNGTAAGTPTTTSYTFTGLTCGTTYTLGVEATDAAGNRSTRSTLSASTSACPDTIAPTAPTLLTSSGITTTAITLSWTASTDNIGVTGYSTFRNGTAVTTTTGTSSTFTGLACGTSHTLGVEATDAAGNRSTRSTLTASTAPCPDLSVPSAPTGLTKGASTTTSITLTWTASSDNVAVAGYTAYRGSTSQGNTTLTTFTFTGLTCGTSYTLGVEAYDNAANRSSRSTLLTSTNACVVDTAPPSVPQGLHTAGTTQTSITLAWNASTDNIGVLGYHMYRDNVRMASIPGLTYTFTGLTCGTLYNLALESYDAAGNVSYRPEAVAMVSTNACSPDSQAPTTPTGLASSGITNAAVTVSWNASTDNVAVTGYGRYSNGSLVSNGAGTSFTFTGLNCNTAYTFGIDAYDAAGNRSSRASINATTSACTAPPPPPPSGSGANLWIDTNGGTCTRSASLVAYSDGAACGTFDQAWDAMAAGDTARIVAGTYGPQKVTGDKTSVTRFIGASKSSVFITGSNNCVAEWGSDGAFCALANYIWLENVTLNSGSFANESASAKVRGGNVRFENVDFWGDHPALSVDGAGSFTWHNGSHGKDGFIPPPVTCSMNSGQPTTIRAPNVTFDNVRFNVKLVQAGAGPFCGPDNNPHLETIRLESSGRNLAILNSLFVAGSDAGSGHIFSQASPPGLRIENTIFEPVDGSYAIQTYNGSSNGWIFRNNRFDQPAIITSGTPIACGNTGFVPTSWKAAC